MISGELAVQGKLRPVSLQGEKKKGTGKEVAGWWVGGWLVGGLKKTLFQF